MFRGCVSIFGRSVSKMILPLQIWDSDLGTMTASGLTNLSEWMKLNIIMATASLQQSPFAYFLAGLMFSASCFYLISNPRFKKCDGGKQARIEGEWDEDDSDDEDHDAFHPLVNKDNPSSSWGYRDAPYKMVLCVNQDLGMGKGKMLASTLCRAVSDHSCLRRTPSLICFKVAFLTTCSIPMGG